MLGRIGGFFGRSFIPLAFMGAMAANYYAGTRDTSSNNADNRTAEQQLADATKTYEDMGITGGREIATSIQNNSVIQANSATASTERIVTAMRERNVTIEKSSINRTAAIRESSSINNDRLVERLASNNQVLLETIKQQPTILNASLTIPKLEIGKDQVRYIANATMEQMTIPIA
jgi:hypothetical protein